jgi:hypothetical protein
VNLVPIVFSKCGHGMNVPSPGIHDTEGALAEEFAKTGKPVAVDWSGGRCLKCTPVTPVGESTIAELAKQRGEWDARN